MIRLVTPGSTDPVPDLYALGLDTHRAGDGRWLYLNMVSSIDGATAVEGGASELTDDDDQALFLSMRAAADVVLVGAETVRAEDYGPMRLSAAAQEQRLERGLDRFPRLAVISRSLALDPASRLFSKPDRRPYLLTGEDAPPDRREVLSEHADVIVAGAVGAELPTALDALADRGHRVILCEGGPTVNGELLRLGLVDEVNLAVSPVMAGGESYRVVTGVGEIAVPFRLERVMLGDGGMTFLRFLRAEPRPAPARP